MENLPQDWLELMEKIAGRHEGSADKLQRHVQLLQVIGSTVNALKEKRILDLGCGAKPDANETIENSRDFEPWYCRLAHEAGADVTGVDIRSNNGESFRHIQMDLLKPRAFDRFDHESYDAVNNDLFTNGDSWSRLPLGFSSPRVIAYIRSKQPWKQRLRQLLRPHLGMQMDGTLLELRKISSDIRTHVTRLLRPGGVYTNSDSIYRKLGDRLVKEKSSMFSEIEK